MDVRERTAEFLRLAADFRIEPGKRVRIERRAKTKEGKRVTREKLSGEVIALYPYIFTVQIGRHITSFRYNELLGDEGTKVRV